jgi:internalin A
MSELALQLIRENKAARDRGEAATSLDLGNCGLTELPKELGDCVWLEELVLGDDWDEFDLDQHEFKKFESQNNGEKNQLTTLTGIEPLLALKRLILRGNKLTDILPLSGLTQLQTLHCSRNQLKDLSILSGLAQLQTLHCSNNQLTELPTLAGLIQLKCLTCSDNQLMGLSFLSGLTQLQMLSCINNQLTDLSPLSGLTQLKTLHCNSNQLKELLPLSGLTQLQTLSCSNNQLTNLLPLSGLTQLQTLSCSNNRLTDLSPLSNLTQLQMLNCSNNQVTELSPLSGLTQLKRLNSSGNQLVDLLPLLPLIRRGIRVSRNNRDFILFQGINIANNPLTNPPIEIAEQGNEAILNYFKEREQGIQYIREAKLLVLGEGGAGKTTLVRKLLRGFAEPMPTEQESTHGIEIADDVFTCTDDTDFSMHIWDFGGQEIYHATHQFFLTKRSLYVLVADVRKEDTNFDYWLEVIGLLSDQCPVLIVQNQRGGRSKALDVKGLQAQFPHLQGVVSLDLSRDEADFNHLRDKLRQHIQALPHTRDEWPISWAAVRRELEAQKQTTPFISLEKYLDLCEQQGLDEESALILSQFLHDFGVCLHFQDDPLLKLTLFLDNRWVTKGVYEVLDNPTVADQKGFFSPRQVQDIWSDPRYRRKRDELLQLMHKFEVAYRLTEKEGSGYLAPHLLSAEAPDLAWSDANNLQLRYDYVFMPKGLLSRLMVRLHRHLPDPDKEAWRTGAVFHRQGAKVRVVEQYRDRQLVLHGLGDEVKALITIISDEIDYLNRQYKGLRVQRMVPCNCRVCKPMAKPHFYTYEDLMRRKERGKATVECPNSYDDVNVLRLIDDVLITTLFTEAAKKVFISYSKSDKAHLDILKKQLRPLERSSQVQVWDDTRLTPGEEWDAAIRRELAAADVVILLVSPDLLATDYVWEVEMEEAIQRHERGQALVVPIIVRPCLWQDAPFARMTALPEKGVPITTASNQDDAWLKVMEQLTLIINRKN